MTASFLRTWLPGLTPELRPFERHNVIAGLTVTAYLVPQVMAYAILAGLSPVTGLWAALVAVPLYALLGTSRWLSFGPESSVAVMTAAVIVPAVAAGGTSPAAVASALALAVGVVGLLASLLRMSFVADLLGRPILVGYMAGIAVLMIDSQLERVTGESVPGDPGVLEHLWLVIGTTPQWSAVITAAGVLAVLVGFARTRLRPFAPLISLVVGAAIAAALSASGQPVELLGDIPAGLPTPALPSVPASLVPDLMLAAVGVLLVAFADATLTGRSFHLVQDPPLRAPTELRALAVVNVAAGFFRGMPVSTSGSRSAVARASGATSQGYSIAAALFLAVVLLVAGPVLEIVPQAALGALVVYAAVLLIDVPGFRGLWRFQRSEFLVALVTTAGVLVFGVLYGVLIAVGLSVLLLLFEVARPHSAVLGFVPDLAGMHDITDFPQTREEPGLLIFRYDSPLFFANADNFLTNARTAVQERMPGVEWFALQSEAIVEVDSTAVEALEVLVRELRAAGVRFVLVRAKSELLDDLSRTSLIGEIGEEYIFPTLPTLVGAFRSRKFSEPGSDESS